VVWSLRHARLVDVAVGDVIAAVVLAQGKRSRFRDHARTRDLSGRSAEYGEVDWSGS